jgi:hypothetical protein
VTDHAGGGGDGVGDLAVVVGGERVGQAGQVGDSEAPAPAGRFDEGLDEFCYLSGAALMGDGAGMRLDVPRWGVADVAGLADVADRLCG